MCTPTNIVVGEVAATNFEVDPLFKKGGLCCKLLEEVYVLVVAPLSCLDAGMYLSGV